MARKKKVEEVPLVEELTAPTIDDVSHVSEVAEYKEPAPSVEAMQAVEVLDIRRLVAKYIDIDLVKFIVPGGLSNPNYGLVLVWSQIDPAVVESLSEALKYSGYRVHLVTVKPNLMSHLD